VGSWKATQIKIATNEAVSAAQFPMLMWIFAAIITLCLITFRSLRATLCIVIPLALVAVFAARSGRFAEFGGWLWLPIVFLGPALCARDATLRDR